jgi:hypothetical protein
MAFTTMHFAVGMGCAAVGTAGACLLVGRGWRWLPAAMTAGGIWAIAPDLPRILHEDLPGPTWLGMLGKGGELLLNRFGDLFFFHATLDSQPREFALHGLMLIVLMYSGGIWLLMALERKQYRRAERHAHHRAARRHLRSAARSPDPPPPRHSVSGDPPPRATSPGSVAGRIGPERLTDAS